LLRWPIALNLWLRLLLILLLGILIQWHFGSNLLDLLRRKLLLIWRLLLLLLSILIWLSKAWLLLLLLWLIASHHRCIYPCLNGWIAWDYSNQIAHHLYKVWLRWLTLRLAPILYVWDIDRILAPQVGFSLNYH